MGIQIKRGDKIIPPTKRLVISVLGEDRVGIIAAVSNVLADHNVNILDINQTLLQEFFAMFMIVDASDCTVSYEKLKDLLVNKGKDIGVRIDVQDEDVFKFMHRV
ncbi:MAG TPA: ACT domain-containing protein [Thermoanaerobacterales bacterium]|nr:ACT domain-containing protein [Thermoanaerobacterales bacterium]